MTILYLSEIQSISGYVVQINYPNNIAIKDEFENVYWIKPFGDFEDKYEIGEEVKYIIIRIQKMAPMKIHYPILLYSVDDVVIYEGGNNCGATGNVSKRT